MQNDSADLRQKLKEFRAELPHDQRRVFNALLGGSVAALRPFSRVTAPEEPESLTQKLVKFRAGLPPEEREALMGMVTASAMAWTVAVDQVHEGGETGGETSDDEQVVFYAVEVAKCVAGLIIAAVLIADILTEDDVEAEVPDLELPDPSGGFPP